MDSAEQTHRTLVYADGYSYTEIFQAPERPGMPTGNQLISVFHAFFTSERDGVSPADQQAIKPQTEPGKASNKTI